MDKIEKYLSTIDKKQRYMIFITIFGLIIYMFTIQIFIPLKDERELVQNSISNLENKIKRDSIRRLKNQLSMKNNELLKLNSRYEKKKDEISKLLSGLYKLKFAFYDNKEWAKSLDKILKESISRKLKIEYIKSRDVLDDKSKDILKKRKTLEISGSGKYIDIVAFISYIDNSNALLNFRESEIVSKNGNVTFKLYVDMYGVGI